MRKIPLYQGKEQPLKNHVADAAADISSGSQVHEQQVAEGGTSNTESRTGRTLAPKHVQRDEEGGASNSYRQPAEGLGNSNHEQQGAGGTSNGEPRTGRALAPKHGQQGAWGGTSSGVRHMDVAGGRGRGVDFDRRKDSAFSVPLDAADGFRKVRESDSGGLSSGVRPVDPLGVEGVESWLG